MLLITLWESRSRNEFSVQILFKRVVKEGLKTGVSITVTVWGWRGDDPSETTPVAVACHSSRSVLPTFNEKKRRNQSSSLICPSL